MNKSQPLNILHKKSINKIEADLLEIRKLFSANPDQEDGIHTLRWVLLACLCSDIEVQNESWKITDTTSFASVAESILGDFVQIYLQGSSKFEKDVPAKSVFAHLKKMQEIPQYNFLLPYALEILEYSESEIRIADYDRRSGIVTKKKKQSGVYYTPLDVAKYMIDCCLIKLKKQKVNLLNCRYIDYSCGSGIFLIQLLDCLIERHLLNMLDLLRSY